LITVSKTSIINKLEISVIRRTPRVYVVIKVKCL